MPKSGSSFLSSVLAQLPRFKSVDLFEGWGRRENELDQFELRRMEEYLYEQRNTIPTSETVGYVAQHHIRHSGPTERRINEFKLTPIVTVRNIFDVTISFKEHILSETILNPMSFTTEEMLNWPDDKLFMFIADMIIPWYFNFYISWNKAPTRLIVTYEEITQSTEECLNRILAYSGLQFDSLTIQSAIKNAYTGKRNIRLNKGVSGRGKDLPERVKNRIKDYVKYYPNEDFSLIGL